MGGWHRQREQSLFLVTLRPAPEVAIRIPRYSEQRLPNGMTLIVYEAPYLPLCAVRLSSLHGAASVPVEQAGLPYVSYRGLQQELLYPDDGSGGLAGLTPVQLDVEQDGASLGGLVHSRDLPALLQRMQQVLERPVPAKTLTLVRALAQQGLHNSTTTPQGAGAAALRRAVFGEGHPYGYPIYGDVRALAAITEAEVALRRL